MRPFHIVFVPDDHPPFQKPRVYPGLPVRERGGKGMLDLGTLRNFDDPVWLPPLTEVEVVGLPLLRSMHRMIGSELRPPYVNRPDERDYLLTDSVIFEDDVIKAEPPPLLRFGRELKLSYERRRPTDALVHVRVVPAATKLGWIALIQHHTLVIPCKQPHVVKAEGHVGIGVDALVALGVANSFHIRLLSQHPDAQRRAREGGLLYQRAMWNVFCTRTGEVNVVRLGSSDEHLSGRPIDLTQLSMRNFVQPLEGYGANLARPDRRGTSPRWQRNRHRDR